MSACPLRLPHLYAPPPLYAPFPLHTYNWWRLCAKAQLLVLSRSYETVGPSFFNGVHLQYTVAEALSHVFSNLPTLPPFPSTPPPFPRLGPRMPPPPPLVTCGPHVQTLAPLPLPAPSLSPHLLPSNPNGGGFVLWRRLMVSYRSSKTVEPSF